MDPVSRNSHPQFTDNDFHTSLAIYPEVNLPGPLPERMATRFLARLRFHLEEARRDEKSIHWEIFREDRSNNRSVDCLNLRRYFQDQRDRAVDTIVSESLKEDSVSQKSSLGRRLVQATCQRHFFSHLKRVLTNSPISATTLEKAGFDALPEELGLLVPLDEIQAHDPEFAKFFAELEQQGINVQVIDPQAPLHAFVRECIGPCFFYVKKLFYEFSVASQDGSADHAVLSASIRKSAVISDSMPPDDALTLAADHYLETHHQLHRLRRGARVERHTCFDTLRGAAAQDELMLVSTAIELDVSRAELRKSVSECFRESFNMLPAELICGAWSRAYTILTGRAYDLNIESFPREMHVENFLKGYVHR